MIPKQFVEQQLRDWLNQLAQEHKHILLQIIAEDVDLLRAERWHQTEALLRAHARSQQLDWDKFNERERASFLEQLTRQDELYSTQVGYSDEPVPPQECAHCGQLITTQDLATSYYSHHNPQAHQRTARFVVTDVENGEVEFMIAPAGETIIGRYDPHRGVHPPVDLTKFDPASRVSRRHARVTGQMGKYFLEDMGSANGTTLNGRTRMKPKHPIELANGDIVKIGETSLKFIC